MKTKNPKSANPHMDMLTTNPYLEELLTIQGIMEKMLPGLSTYEAASLSLQYIHTRTVSEAIAAIAEGVNEQVLEALEAIAKSVDMIQPQI
jgi:hypothetical protein